MKIKNPARFVTFIMIMLLIITGAIYVLARGGSIPQLKFGYFGLTDAFNKKGVQRFIVAGTDKGKTRTDLILAVSYNYSTGKLTALQIPRDTKVENSRYDKKINSAWGSAEKEQALYSEIKYLTGLDFDRHVVVDFDGFRDIIDIIGGVEIDVPIRMKYTDIYQDLVIDIEKGLQTLNGEKAVMFMRFRMNSDGTGYPEGDIGRIKAQKEFYNAALDKLISARTFMRIPKIVETVNNCVTTNMTEDEILRLIGVAMRINQENVTIMQLPGHSGGPNENISYFYFDKEETTKIVEEFMTEQ